jgi:hypothetical protein
LAAAVEQSAAVLHDAIPDAFTGDAHAFLMSVYKDPSKPESLRVDAAKAAIRFEKPSLSSVAANVSSGIDVRAWLQSLGEPS